MLGACSTADNAVTTACADLSGIQSLVPVVEALVSTVPTASADVVAANALLNGECAVAPAVEAMVAKLNADISAAAAKK